MSSQPRHGPAQPPNRVDMSENLTPASGTEFVCPIASGASHNHAAAAQFKPTTKSFWRTNAVAGCVVTSVVAMASYTTMTITGAPQATAAAILPFATGVVVLILLHHRSRK